MARRWGRKRKQEEKVTKASKPRKENNNKDNNNKQKFSELSRSSAPMEAYYAYQGLHNHYLPKQHEHEQQQQEKNNGKKSSSSTSLLFQDCMTDEQKEKERVIFMKTMAEILPVSFRIGQNIESNFRETLEEELQQFVGKEFDILVNEDGTNFNRRLTTTTTTTTTPQQDGDGDVEMKEEREEGKEEKNGTTIETSKDVTTEEHKSTTPTATETTTTTKMTEDAVIPEYLSMKKVAPVKSIPYIPHAYQLSVDRRTLRRNPTLGAFHDWVKIQTDAGFITRQETVSMIPPVVLGAEPHHHILDMCAAPGSKTSQLLEIVGDIPDGQIEPAGFVVANDSDAKRAYMLVHQLRRLNNPAAFVTAVDAQFWPMLKNNKPMDFNSTNTTTTTTTPHNHAEEGIFDRVLCDVPCSGDGTARKNPGIWKQWTNLGALGLHPLQLSIGLNGARLTKVGGFVCYSTCSMNPIENEAVVAELLRLSDGSLELVDRRDKMEDFRARPGWSSWKVMSEVKTKKQMKNEKKKYNEKMQKRRKEWAEKEEACKLEKSDAADTTTAAAPEEPKTDEATQEEEKANNDEDGQGKEEEIIENTTKFNIQKSWVGTPPSWDEETLRERALATGLEEFKTFEDVPEHLQRRIRKSCFPPTQEEADKFNMEKCMRCLPQDMDTGGFFVALFKKVAPLNERAKRLAKELSGDSRPDAKAEERTEVKTEKTNNVKNEEAEEDTSTKASNEETTTTEKTETTDDATDTTDNDKLVKGKTLLRGRGKSRGNEGNDDFVATNEELIPPLVDFYGLSDSFARGQLMCRQNGGAKMLYFITSTVKKHLIDKNVQDRVTVINSGLRAFERGSRDGTVRYRPCQESIHFIAPHMLKRKIIANLTDFEKCLKMGAIKAEIFSEKMQTEIKALDVGAFVIALEGFELNVAKKMFLTMWRCRGETGTTNCLVTQKEQDGMQSKLRAIKAEKENGSSSA